MVITMFKINFYIPEALRPKTVTKDTAERVIRIDSTDKHGRKALHAYAASLSEDNRALANEIFTSLYPKELPPAAKDHVEWLVEWAEEDDYMRAMSEVDALLAPKPIRDHNRNLVGLIVHDTYPTNWSKKTFDLTLAGSNDYWRYATLDEIIAWKKENEDED